MKLKLAIVIILITSLLNGCTFSVPGTLSLRSGRNNGKFALPFISYLHGKKDYGYNIRMVAYDYGYKAALNVIINDVVRNEGEFHRSSYEEALELYRLTSFLIGKIGYVDMKTHYFRNKLNKAPDNLSNFLKINSSLPILKQWKLISVKNSLYHMQGKDGEYNMKFVSPEGFCEAVYNKNGVLLTETNDPVNMGTFNYGAGIKQVNAHVKYDVDPYLKWGNSGNSPQKTKDAMLDGKKRAYENYLKNAESVEHYRNSVVWRIETINYIATIEK